MRNAIALFALCFVAALCLVRAPSIAGGGNHGVAGVSPTPAPPQKLLYILKDQGFNSNRDADNLLDVSQQKAGDMLTDRTRVHWRKYGGEDCPANGKCENVIISLRGPLEYGIHIYCELPKVKCPENFWTIPSGDSTTIPLKVARTLQKHDHCHQQ